MKTKDFDKLGDECFNHLKALNPKGGMKTFIRMAVEFGYKKAVKNLTIQNVIKRNSSKWDEWKFVVGLITGMMIGLIILHYVL